MENMIERLALNTVSRYESSFVIWYFNKSNEGF